MNDKIEANLQLIEIKAGENGEIEQKQKKIADDEEFMKKIIGEKNHFVENISNDILTKLCKLLTIISKI